MEGIIMNNTHREGHSNRRSNSQLLPRIYMFLQIAILVLSEYLMFMLLVSLGMPSAPLLAFIGIVTLFYLGKFFFKCQYISTRSRLRGAF